MTPRVITSRKNEEIRRAARLCTDAGYRREQGAYLVEGARLCADAAESGVKIHCLYFTERAREKYGAYLERIAPCAADLCQIETSVAQLLSDTKTSQGVFCVCALPEEDLSFEEIVPKGRYIALENIQDPSNLGAVLRTAEALGIDGAFLGGSCCDLYMPKTLRASMGAVFRLPCFILPAVGDGFRQLARRGFQVLAAVPDRTATPIMAVNFTKGAVLAVGNEGSGITQEALKACTGRVTIPMLGRAESLNAASSAAILMWEMMRT